MVKILADATTDEILGVHIVGPMASELIAEAVVAMEFKASSRGHRAHLPCASVPERGDQGSGAGGGQAHAELLRSHGPYVLATPCGSLPPKGAPTALGRPAAVDHVSTVREAYDAELTTRGYMQ